MPVTEQFPIFVQEAPMDRRQQKTRAAIVQAFTLLVQKKPF